MGINEGDTTPAFDVLEHHRFDERGLSGAGFSDNVDMGKAIFVLDAEDPVGATKIGTGELGDVGGMHAPCSGAVGAGVRGQNVPDGNIRSFTNRWLSAQRERQNFKNTKSFDREKFFFENFRFSKSEILKSDFFVRERDRIELFRIDQRRKTSPSSARSPALRLLLMPLSAGTSYASSL